MDEPGSVSDDAGSISIDPGSISFGPGAASPNNDDPSVSTDIADSSACSNSGKDFDAFLRLFPKGAGVKLGETMERYNRLIDMGISPEALYDSWKHFESEMRFSSPFFVAPRERRECNVQVRRATGFVVVEDDH